MLLSFTTSIVRAQSGTKLTMHQLSYAPRAWPCFDLRPVRRRSTGIVAEFEENEVSNKRSTAGVGFGQRRDYSEEVERGRKTLDALRQASEQGSMLQTPAKDEPVEVPQEFKSKLILGFAGFLITTGIAFLIIGGSISEPKGFNEEGTPPVDATPAFGFVPKSETATR
eukprot:CAMPEP_0119331146 /NCGR_PEP_ID=MMETSP1333-20130426/79915_1 /TAXON_ID=418940 /ORGANISM="Scyphosphaera apsteinii, Strain RCC1455" /LENGTH=167 /DNA_ID=CAMNT_0007340673 /DNA_START=74 /DNA_END=577 /DNA_ORIENTATION=-